MTHFFPGQNEIQNDQSATVPSLYAIFGGTFDPPHLGHLKPLQQTLDLLGIHNIGLMPANQPALKSNTTPIQHRLNMTQLLCDLDIRFTVDTTEIDRGGKTYTVDTLSYLKQQHKSRTLVFIMGLDSIKSISKWYKWQDLFKYAHLVVMCRDKCKIPTDDSLIQTTTEQHSSHKTKLASNLYNIYTSERQFHKLMGSEMDEKTRSLLLSKLALADKNLSNVYPATIEGILNESVEGKLWFVNNDLVQISSTEIRLLLKQKQDISQLVPTSIVDYISKNKLYL